MMSVTTGITELCRLSCGSLIFISSSSSGTLGRLWINFVAFPGYLY